MNKAGDSRTVNQLDNFYFQIEYNRREIYVEKIRYQ